MKFGHKDYFHTKKIFLEHFLGVFLIHKFKNDVFVHDFLSH